MPSVLCVCACVVFFYSCIAYKFSPHCKCRFADCSIIHIIFFFYSEFLTGMEYRCSLSANCLYENYFFFFILTEFPLCLKKGFTCLSNKEKIFYPTSASQDVESRIKKEGRPVRATLYSASYKYALGLVPSLLCFSSSAVCST